VRKGVFTPPVFFLCRFSFPLSPPSSVPTCYQDCYTPPFSNGGFLGTFCCVPPPWLLSGMVSFSGPTGNPCSPNLVFLFQSDISIRGTPAPHLFFFLFVHAGPLPSCPGLQYRPSFSNLRENFVELTRSLWAIFSFSLTLFPSPPPFFSFPTLAG